MLMNNIQSIKIRSFFKLCLILLIFIIFILPEKIYSKPTKKNKKPVWQIDLEESYIYFEVPTIFNTIKGKMDHFFVRNFKYKGYYKSLRNNELWIPVNSITTNSPYRDEGIRSEFFLNEKKYPYIKIKVLNIYPFNIQENYYFVDLEIEIKNIKKVYKDIVYIQQRWNKVIAKGETILSRSDFNLYGNIILNFFLSDKIIIKYNIVIIYK
ncbi:MAG: hypothetical protein KatS3mg129_2624 [Leptospiraceae bacterium]|nr:MAG: hypothetical protein KatS3mg129_2624 [Leptospiraceae bacterium]